MMRMLAIAILSCAALAGTARAQPDPGPAPDDAGGAPAPDPNEARRWLDAGDTLMKGGDKLSRRGKTEEATSQYERALISYQKAQELSGNPQVFFAIGAAYEKLGKPGEALLAYRKVTLLAADKPALVEIANQRLAILAEGVGLFSAKVDPYGAELLIDGEPVGKSPLAEPLVLQPGTYTLMIVADAHQPLEIKIEIQAGSESERTFKLEPVLVAFDQVKDAPRPDRRNRGPQPPSRIVLWIGAGATLAFAGVATATGGSAVARHHVYTDPASSGAERESAQDAGRKLSIATDVCLVGAVLAAGFTTYYALAVYRPGVRAHRRAMETRAKAAVVPWVQPNVGGIALAVTY